jgi:hypothetical protein
MRFALRRIVPSMGSALPAPIPSRATIMEEKCWRKKICLSYKLFVVFSLPMYYTSVEKRNTVYKNQSEQDPMPHQYVKRITRRTMIGSKQKSDRKFVHKIGFCGAGISVITQKLKVEAKR